MGKILLNGMRFFAYHGVTELEREQGQEFIIDLEIVADVKQAAEADDLSLTVDYDKLYQHIGKVVTGPPVRLIETLAIKIAGAVLGFSPLVEGVLVRVKKPAAPIDGELKWAGVEVKKER